MRFKAVFFDAGETLLSPHPSFHELFSLVLSNRGHLVAPEQVERALFNMAPSFSEVMDRLAVSGWSVTPEASRQFWGQLYGAALHRLEVADPRGDITHALFAKFTEYGSYRLFPDALPALEAVKEAGYFVGLISNFEEWLEGMLIEMEVASLFDLMVISGKEGIEKPDPAIFELALDRSGFDAANAIYVGDHPRIDVQGARAVGMSAVLIDRRGRHAGFEGDRISSLAKLLPLLEG
ncbi:MAG: HAD family hydrolase [Actinomycetota bacterium]